MNLEAIFAEWDVDNEIDRTELAEELRRLPKLHGKYWRYMIDERLRLRMLEAEMKALRLAKNGFYQDGPDEDTRAKGWDYPVKGRILRSDTPLYLDADREIQALAQRIDLAKEKVTLLESILHHIKDRGFHLRDISAWVRFQAGG
jgi:hypothetical protein